MNLLINGSLLFFFNYFLDDVSPPSPPTPPSPPQIFHLIYDESLGNFIVFF